MLADAAAELAALVDRLGIPVAHSLMGKGALPDDHPFTLGMTGFWGTQYINDTCRNADVILALGTRFCEADCSSWDPEYTFNIPAHATDPHRHRSQRDRSQLSGRDRRHRRSEAGADRAQPRRQEGGARWPPQRMLCARRSRPIARSSRRAITPRKLPTSFPCGRSASWPTCAPCLPRDAIITTDVGWNKNGVGQQFPIYTPGLGADAGRLRHHGVRRARRDRRQDRLPGQGRGFAGRRWRLRSEPGAARRPPSRKTPR